MGYILLQRKHIPPPLSLRQEVPTGDTNVKLRQERHQCSHHTLTTWLRELCEWIGFYQGSVERFQAIAGATSGHGSAATTRGCTHKQGVKCVVANTHGLFHTRSERRHKQLAKGSRITPEAPEAGRPESASRGTRPDCRVGSERVQNCIHRRVLKKIEPQRHAQGRWLRCICNRR